MADVNDALLRTICSYEKRLIETREAVDEMLGLVRQLAREIGSEASVRQQFTGHERDAPLEGSAGGDTHNWTRQRSALLERDSEAGYSFDSQFIHLTPRETQVLNLLWDTMPRRVGRQQFSELLYGRDLKSDNVSIDVFLSSLRGKLRQATGRELIQVSRGVGWVLRR